MKCSLTAFSLVTQGAYIETLVVAPFTSRPRDAAGMIVAKIIYQTLRNRDSVAIYTYKNCSSFGGGTTLCDMSSCYWTHGWGSYHRLTTNSLTGVRFSIEGAMTTIKVVRFVLPFFSSPTRHTSPRESIPKQRSLPHKSKDLQVISSACTSACQPF